MPQLLQYQYTPYTSTDLVWTYWAAADNTTFTGNQFIGVTANASTTLTWQNWIGTGTSNTWTQWVTVENCSFVPETDEQRVARAARAEEARISRVAYQARCAEAKTRAEELLLEQLSPEQRVEYLAHKHFHVNGSRGNRYRIKCGRAHNVYTIRDGRPVMEHCAHVLDHVPNEDNILVQKLMLEHNEDLFLQTANTRTLAAA